jgi:hypothetical protein
MAKMVWGTIGLVVLVALAGGAGWAEQREARLVRGPMSPLMERPTVVACTNPQSANCTNIANSTCTSACTIVANCQPCKDKAKSECEALTCN